MMGKGSRKDRDIVIVIVLSVISVAIELTRVASLY